MQIGHGRAGWCSHEWVERLFGIRCAEGHSATRIHPDTQFPLPARRRTVPPTPLTPRPVAAFCYRGVTTAITVLGLLIVAISMVALINTLTMVVLERTREIGILRCIGAHARDVRQIFATEGLTVALAGWLIGIPLGFGLAHAVVTLAENVFNEHLLFTFPVLNIPIALIGTLLLALLVIQIPLRRAVRFKPGEALRYA